MSSGPFLDAFYTTDNADVVGIRVQPETVALVLEGATNTVPAGPAAPGFPSAMVSGGKTRIGINARKVRVKFALGGAPTGYKDGSTIELPWLDPLSFLTLPAKASGTYLGSPVTLVGKTAESIK